MSSPIEESPIINSDIENDVTSSHRNLIENGPGWYFIPKPTKIKKTVFVGYSRPTDK